MYSLRACALLALAGGALVDAAPAAGYCLVQPRPVTESAVASSAITSEYVVSSSVTPVASSSITPSSVTSSSISSSSVISSSVTPSPVTSSSATPTPTPFKECDPADAVNAVLIGLEADASPLCLAYLGGDKTVEETQTATVTGDTVTITVTAAAETVTTDIETIETITVTSTATAQEPDAVTIQIVTVTAPAQTLFQKRDVLPATLLNFAPSQISSACSCIATPTTVTVTSTATQSIEGPQITESAPGVTVTITQIETLQLTVPNTITVTAPPTSTQTETITTTTTPVVIVVQPKTCNAKGLPGPRAFNYAANFNTNQEACIAACKTDPRCGSTGFYIVTNANNGQATGTCRSYDKSVADSADLGLGYYTWNDKAC